MEPPDGLPPICENCGYNLTGLTGHICPECGQPFFSNAPYVSRIAWAARGEIGAARAYVRTVFDVCFRPGMFVRESLASSSRAVIDAEIFQKVTLNIAGVSAGMGLAGFCCTLRPEKALWLLLLLGPILCALLCSYLLVAAQVVQDIRLFPKDGVRRPMARVMLRYACAPLVLTPAIVAIEIAGQVLHSWTFTDLNSLVGNLLLALPLILPFLWWGGVLHLAAAMSGSAATIVEVVVFVPMGWGIMGLVWGAVLVAGFLVVARVI